MLNTINSFNYELLFTYDYNSKIPKLTPSSAKKIKRKSKKLLTKCDWSQLVAEFS